MFYTLSSRLLAPPNTIFVTDHTRGYFVNVLPDWLECYIAICIDWLYVQFTALCFCSPVEVRFDISVIKELIDWLIGARHLTLIDVCIEMLHNTKLWSSEAWLLKNRMQWMSLANFKPKRTARASHSFFAAARLSCWLIQPCDGQTVRRANDSI